MINNDIFISSVFGITSRWNSMHCFMPCTHGLLRYRSHWVIDHVDQILRQKINSRANWCVIICRLSTKHDFIVYNISLLEPFTCIRQDCARLPLVNVVIGRLCWNIWVKLTGADADVPTMRSNLTILVTDYTGAWWRHQMLTFSALLAFCEVESTGHRWIPLTKASDAELWCFLWSVPELKV